MTQNIGYGLIILLLILILHSRYLESGMLSGFWRADAEFCTNAELDMFILYLGDRKLFGSRDGYLFASNQNGIILNNPVNFSMSGGYSASPVLCKEKKYNITIDWKDMDLEDDNAFPSEFSMSYFPKHCKLVLHKEDTVLAILWKDHQMTAVSSDDVLNPDAVIIENNSEEI